MLAANAVLELTVRGKWRDPGATFIVLKDIQTDMLNKDLNHCLSVEPHECARRGCRVIVIKGSGRREPEARRRCPLLWRVAFFFPPRVSSLAWYHG